MKPDDGLWITFKKEVPFLIACLTWFLLWFAGCVIFDYVLQLKGGWLMLVGAFTMKLCSYVAEKIDP